MIWFYLFAIVLMQTGEPGSAVPVPYASQQECDEAAIKMTEKIRADSTVKQGATLCLPVDFDVADPLPVPTRKS